MSELEFSLTLYPDPILRKVADPIVEFDDDLLRTVEAMLERMHESRGVGLAAPQVGLRKRILVLNAGGEGDEDIVLINPELLDRTGAKTLFDEGCLSFPGIYAEIERPDACKVAAQDVEGNRFEASYKGFTSRIVQHEYDHLEGILLVDRMSPADKLTNRNALDQLISRYKANQAPAS